MTTRTKTGSVFALGIRLTRLAPSGAPLVGPDNAYVTDNLVKLDYTLNYRDRQEKERLNGQGKACLYYAAPATVKDLSIDSLELCYPDAELNEFLAGGDVLVDADTDTIGYAAPEVGTDPVPNGIAIEAWSSAVGDDEIDSAFPFIHWLFPREKLRPNGSSSISADPLAQAFSGSGSQNSAYGNGGFNDWIYESSRVYQWIRAATMPDLTLNGYIAVPADVP
jgi:hypothetical protein